MKKEALQKMLRSEIDRWSLKPYEELSQLRNSSYDNGRPTSDPAYYQTEVQVLSVRPGYVQVSVCVDDGGLRSFFPMCSSFLVYKDGRVDK